MLQFFLGRLNYSSLPHSWYTVGGTVALFLMLVIGAGVLTYFKRWRWLWEEWLTATDPKKIGVMYIAVASLMFFRGVVDAIMMWIQQSLSVGNNHGYLSAAHFQQIATAHGDIMVFFTTMGFLLGLINLVMPLQIGARDLAFPFINSLSYWLYVAGAILINTNFVFGGDFAATGWLAETPLSELQFSPGIGMDYWIWSLQLSGLGSLLSGVNFLVTIIKMRAPGMTLLKMPMFVWASLCNSILIITVFPILTIDIAMLTLDRYLGMHFFTTTGGGNNMMYINLVWMWGHPEVYILVIPSYGLFSEIVSTFSRKTLAGYKSQVAGLVLVALISEGVWLHHFYTMGSGADVNAAFGVATELIVIPTAVLFINWFTTMFRGRVTLALPMYWFLGFIVTFTFGGLAGMLLAIPATDYQVHSSLFLIAHFHTQVIGGALFGIFAGLYYWFPKFAGFRLDERIGKRAFWHWLVGFYLAFVPLYILGFMGATRRLDHYTDPTWRPFFVTAAIGVLVIVSGAILQVYQLIVSIRNREQYRDTTGDPWGGRTLEWATPSPPPKYNFAVIPYIHSREPFWDMKQEKQQRPKNYEDIELAKNTGMGVYISAFAFLFGFAMVWHMYLIAIIGFIGIITCVILRTFNEHSEYTLPASEIQAMESA